MGINKKFGRVKQWAGEKMGAESKTGVSDEFHSLELEMQLRHDGNSPCSSLHLHPTDLLSPGTDKIHRSTTTYLKSLAKRNEGDDKEKLTPIDALGQTLLHHGEDFEADSEYGNCLIGASSKTYLLKTC